MLSKRAVLRPYSGRPEARQACALNHLILWKLAVESNRPVLILEHDAEFIRPLDDIAELGLDRWLFVSINDPRGATAAAERFHRAVHRSEELVVEAPRVRGPLYLRGLPGASAYICTPRGAELALRAVQVFGLWPNDAIVSRQVLGRGVGVLRHYVTRVQSGVPSTMGA